ncbi:hypothetical protein TKK_0009467 [Trichogramma kaykai]
MKKLREFVLTQVMTLESMSKKNLSNHDYSSSSKPNKSSAASHQTTTGPHFSKDCTSKFTCQHCKQRHHTQLHRKSANVQALTSDETPIEIVQQPEVAATSSHAQACTLRNRVLSTLLANARINVKSGDGSSILVRALVDQYL